MSTTLPEYNGWPNQPTWHVYHRLSDDGDDYLTVCQLVQGAGDIVSAAVAVRAWVDERRPIQRLANGLSVDLLDWALAQVDWEAVVQAFALEEWSDDRPEGS